MEEYRSDAIRHYERQLPGMMQIPRFYEYARQVYDYLEVMKPGKVLNLKATDDKLPWLLVTTGAFLAASDHWMDFELNDDYTRIRRKPLPPDFRKAMGKQPVKE